MPVAAFRQTRKKSYMHLQPLHNINHVQQRTK